MNTAVDHRSSRTEVSDGPVTQPDLASMDRAALVSLVESLFRWVLKHTGLTRQQVMAQIRQNENERRVV